VGPPEQKTWFLAMRVDMDWVRRAFEAQPTPVDRRAPVDHHAVVAAIFRQAPRGAEVLLIRRSENEQDPWSGHMALPGGHRDAADGDLLATATREVAEEIGLDLERDAEFLGRLPSTRVVIQSRTLDFAIIPLVFWLQAQVEPALNPLEVQLVVWAPVEHLLSPAARSSLEVPIREQRHRFPAYDVEGHRVWGLTYRILQNLLAVLAVGPLGPEREGAGNT
jgi:8-oxo-dGTP pyrophosphatase MutT (NUDIX family)